MHGALHGGSFEYGLRGLLILFARRIVVLWFAGIGSFEGSVAWAGKGVSVYFSIGLEIFLLIKIHFLLLYKAYDLYHPITRIFCFFDLLSWVHASTIHFIASNGHLVFINYRWSSSFQPHILSVVRLIVPFPSAVETPFACMKAVLSKADCSFEILRESVSVFLRCFSMLLSCFIRFFHFHFLGISSSFTPTIASENQAPLWSFCFGLKARYFQEELKLFCLLALFCCQGFSHFISLGWPFSLQKRFFLNSC